MAINQAVIFTKPVYHLSHDLSPDALYERVDAFLQERRFYVRTHRSVTGAELQGGGIMDQQ